LPAILWIRRSQNSPKTFVSGLFPLGRLCGHRRRQVPLELADPDRLGCRRPPDPAIIRLIMKKSMIWDFNGTILDDRPICLQALNQMLGRRGLPPVSDEAYLAEFDFPVQHYYSRLGFDFEREPFSELAAEYMAIYQPASFHCPLRQGVRPILDEIARQGLDQILLSATRRDFLLEQLRHFALAASFTAILGLEDIYGRSKLEMACRWFGEQGYAADGLLLIGDTTHDFEVAHALGCRCILVGGGHNARSRLVATGASVIDELSDLPDLISAWRRDT
jgi:phosphoglycolate phosphatase